MAIRFMALGLAGSLTRLDAADISGQLPIANGGTGAASASAARSALGVAYGVIAGTVAQGNDSRLATAAANFQVFAWANFM